MVAQALQNQADVHLAMEHVKEIARGLVLVVVVLDALELVRGLVVLLVQVLQNQLALLVLERAREIAKGLALVDVVLDVLQDVKEHVQDLVQEDAQVAVVALVR